MVLAARRHAGEQGRGQQVDRGLAEPRGDIGVDRILVDLPRRSDLHQPAGLDHADPRRHGHGFGLIVGDIEDGGAEIGLDALEFEPHLAAQLGVQRGQRLVHQIDRGRAHQRPADRDALHLPARQLRRLVVQLGFDVQQTRHFFHFGADLGFRHPADRRTQRKSHVLEHAQVRIQRILLEHEGDVTIGRRIAGDVAPADPDRTAIRHLQSGDEAQGRGLAGARRPEQRDEFAVCNGQGQIADRSRLAERLGDGSDFDFSHAPLLHATPCGSPAPIPCQRSTAYRAGSRARHSRRSEKKCWRASGP